LSTYEVIGVLPVATGAVQDTFRLVVEAQTPAKAVGDPSAVRWIAAVRELWPPSPYAASWKLYVPSAVIDEIKHDVVVV
jgi:hypothetical protein